ncbi:zinc ABC transporter substrate-binding protein [Lachnoanaerobaculum sp. JCM 36186]|jgi:periplasmic solute binding family protein|uniref:metal ABC transporter substrate-binding protein n=1 Tax=Lachnoanaerobaculum sanguinis TaxID=3065809 RepID=UPI00274CA145|nr:metal ABC transporter substrate-binding protein [Lachnoanaerobaculum sp. JCM 36186]GMO02607.1 zinc ABC transporter substrate-binding protein [Lachnoanaerobaculum sp. JCM 36186]
MKKYIGIGLSILVAIMMVLGCAKKESTGSSEAESGSSVTESSSVAESNSEETKKLSIVTTIFPAYDWVKQVVGDNKNVEISFLIDKGVDLHSYQASAADIAKITDSDLFVYVGGDSDDWAEDIIKENPNLNYINMVDSIGEAALAEELVEGMQDEEEHDNESEEHANEEGEHEEGEEEIDEHVWLSIKNAETIVSAIEAKLAEIDPDNKAEYEKNANDYLAKLDELDKEYKDTLSSIQNKTIIVGDRFPFRYLVNEYGIKYYAAFKGCDAGSEASFETVKFLANKMDELNMSDIFIIDGSKGDLAKTIVDNTKDKNAKVLVLDSMQSTKSSDNASYLDIMKKNLEVLKEVL